METTKLISFKKLTAIPLKIALQRYGLYAYFLMLLASSLTVIVSLVFILDRFSESVLITSATAFVLALVAIASILSLVLAAFGMNYALVFPSKNLNLFQASKMVLPLVWSIVWVGILSEMIQATGTVLLVVPAIVFSIYVALAQYVVMTESYRGLDALVRATQMVYGRFWSVFGRLLYITVLYVGMISVVIFSGIFLLSVLGMTPYLAAAMTLVGVGVSGIFVLGFISALVMLFRSEQEVSPADTFVAAEWERVRFWYKVAAWAGIFATILLNSIDSWL